MLKLNPRRPLAMTDLASAAATGEPPWLRRAWLELGTAERGASADNPRIVDYARQLGHSDVTSDEVPWCAAFLGACLETSGYASTRSLRARSYLDWGTALSEARLGAIAVFSRGSDLAAGHVGFLISDLGEDLVVLGGNQSDAVTTAIVPRSRLLSLRWPIASNEDASEAPPASTESTLFEHSLTHILKVEGGYSNDPYDPGGPTNFGITLATLAAERRRPLDDDTRAALTAELKQLTPAKVGPIYLRRYWTPCQAEHLPGPLALMHFDAAVNHGVTGAARLLQRALNVEIDGEIGPITLAAANTGNALDHLVRYAIVRRERYRALPHYWRFGRGWLARIEITLAAARALPPATRPPTQRQKEKSMTTNSASTSAQQPKWWGASMTIWGTIITALSTVLPVIGPLIGLDITAEMIRQFGSAIVQVMEALGGVIGIALTIFGRMRATQPLMRRSLSVRL